MEIRARLTIQFIAIVTLIVALCFGVVYYSSSVYRKNELYQRLENKARTSAEIFVSVEQIDSTMLRIFDQTQKDKLPLENISIYNHENHEIYTNNDTLSFEASPGLLDQVRSEGRVEFSDGTTEILGITYNDNYNRFVVFAGADDLYGISKLHNLRNTLIVLFFITITIVAATGWIYAGRALKPLNDVVVEVKRMDVERLDIRLKKSRHNDEIGRLIATFNTMLDRLENAVNLKKLFVTGASHELKNPLTSITSQLQVILLNERSNEEYKQLIRSTLEDIKKLNRTTLDLIEYARLSYENRIQTTAVRIDDILWSCKDFFLKTNSQYKVNIRFANMPEDENQLIIQGNEAMLSIAFMNLIDNACKFSPDKACDVKLTVELNSIVIEFADKGIGLDEDELKLIYEPFYRSNKTAEQKGHGIGLALTKKIIDLHRAGIWVVSSKGMGTTFTVTFQTKF